MDRLTKLDNDKYIIANDNITQLSSGYCGQVVDKLAKFEDMLETILNRQKDIEKELEILRLNNKDKTVKFRELLGEKLLNTQVITLFKKYGILF